MRSERCLQEITGSCAGCNILNIVAKRANRGQTVQEAAEEVSSVYCPDDASVQTHHITNRSPVAMGAISSNLVTVGI